jgi:molybdopterin converting factor small subunit
MQPQGAAVFNPAYLANITDQINGIADDVDAINPCAAIQAIVDEAMAEIQTEIEAMESQIAVLNILITIPTSLGGCIKWITNFVAPSITVNLNYIKQMIKLIAALENLMAAIEAAAARLSNCQISIAAPVVSLPLPNVAVRSS